MAHVEILHGSAQTRWLNVGRNDLISARHPDNPPESGTLTDNLPYAIINAYAAAITRRSLHPFVARYNIDDAFLIDEGPIAGHPDAKGFSTRLTVSPNYVPASYLLQDDLTPDYIQDLTNEGYIFYRVPHEAFAGFVDFPIPEKVYEALRRYLT